VAKPIKKKTAKERINCQKPFPFKQENKLELTLKEKKEELTQKGQNYLKKDLRFFDSKRKKFSSFGSNRLIFLKF
jgi:hypothetical protein